MIGVAAQRQPAAPRPRRRARAGEALLADALEREARAPLGRLAVVVRLSRLPPPGPRPYHRRIARALLEDCALRHGGQVVALATGDLVLLAIPEGEAGPATLTPLLLRLLQVDGDIGGPVAEAIPLAGGQARLRALLDDAEAAEDAPGDHAAVLRAGNFFAGRLAHALPGLAPHAAAAALEGGIAGLLQFQTAVRLPLRDAAPAAPLRPVHRALRIAPTLLAARLAGQAGGGGGLPADPWLRQHLAETLAEALLAWLQQCEPDPMRRAAPPLLLALPPAVINGPGFAAFSAHIAGPTPRVAISMAEASADPAAFAAARARLHATGMALVLDGLSHHALLLARPEMLEPDLFALSWTTTRPRLPPARLREIAAAVQRLGAGRVLLTGADSEAALRWGRAAGIQMFQGHHAEAMLAATRLQSCPGARGCDLRACAERATATQPAGRAGCTNPRLLAQGVPDPVHALAQAGA